MENIREWNPAEGMAFQGDVSLIPLAAGIVIDMSDEIAPVDCRLILQEGEVTGHHHAITLPRRGALENINVEVERLMSDALAGKIALPSARMFRDPKVAAEMQRRGILTRTDLIVGVLIIEMGPMALTHEEHDAIRNPAGTGRTVHPDLSVWGGGYSYQEGRYLVGRQVESAGAEERKVRD